MKTGLGCASPASLDFLKIQTIGRSAFRQNLPHLRAKSVQTVVLATARRVRPVHHHVRHVPEAPQTTASSVGLASTLSTVHVWAPTRMVCVKVPLSSRIISSTNVTVSRHWRHLLIHITNNSLIGCGAKCTSCKIPNFSVASTIDQVQCTGCLPGFFLSDGKCVESCPSGTFVSQQDNLTCTREFISHPPLTLSSEFYS